MQAVANAGVPRDTSLGPMHDLTRSTTAPMLDCGCDVTDEPAGRWLPASH
jgi:hypothetical protein